MIKGLRRKLTLLVIAVLVLVTAGIVLSTDLANRRNIASAAQKALQTHPLQQRRAQQTNRIIEETAANAKCGDGLFFCVLLF